MIKITFRIPFLEDHSEIKKIDTSKILDFLNERFENEISKTIIIGKEKCEIIANDVKQIMKEINDLDQKGKNIFSTPINKIPELKIPENINYSTLSNFLINSNDIVKQINSLSPTSKTISNYEDCLNSIATKLGIVFKKINDLQKFLQESDIYRNYNMVEKELNSINEENKIITNLSSEIQITKKEYGNYSLNNIDEEIKKLKESKEIDEYNELNNKILKIEEDIIDKKNKITSTIGEIRRPINKIMHQTGKNKIVESCFENPLECLNHENIEEIFSKIISTGFISLRNELDKDSISKLKNFQTKFNKNFIESIKQEIKSLEDERERTNNLLINKSKIFYDIKLKEHERNETSKQLSRTDKEIRDRKEEIEKLENKIRERKNKISNILYEILDEKIQIN
ncbi:MAG: hypothetical protein J4428_00785 [Candidatus Aenigmarchaeota archaeon]|nr:hypothetical protein [Candidatus Aenigmarchaeota archaeon]